MTSPIVVSRASTHGGMRITDLVVDSIAIADPAASQFLRPAPALHPGDGPWWSRQAPESFFIAAICLVLLGPRGVIAYSKHEDRVRLESAALLASQRLPRGNSPANRHKQLLFR